MASVKDAHRLSQMEHGLATVATVRFDGSIQLALVNAGVVTHPVTGAEVGAFIARNGTRKLRHLRARPFATLQWRAGWSWVALEGHADLCGPDDPMDDIGPDDLRRLFRQVARAGSAVHEDWDEFDRTVAAERRTAVLVTPRRIYQNP